MAGIRKYITSIIHYKSIIYIISILGVYVKYTKSCRMVKTQYLLYRYVIRLCILTSRVLHGYTVHQRYPTLYCPTNAYNVRKRRVIKKFKIKYTLTQCTTRTPHRSQYAAITLTKSCTSSTYLL